MVGESLTIEVRNSRDAIAPASAKAESLASVSSTLAPGAEPFLLAIEELVTNCIQYGYDDAHEHTILSCYRSMAVT